MTDSTSAPFTAPFPVRSIDDVRRLEATPLGDALRVRSTYEIFRNSARAFGSKTALTFLRSADLTDAPIRWSYAELLAGIHQTANLLHTLGVGAGDAVAVMLPGCLEYHLALWGGEAAGIVQPLNPLLSDDKLVALMNAARAKVLIAYGSDDECSISTGSPKLARHSHGAQVFSAWASVKLQGLHDKDITINGYPLFHVAGVLPASLASLSAGVEVIIPTVSLLRNRDVLANYWRLIEKYRVTSLSAVPTVLAALANVPLGDADISSVRYCRTGASPLPPELAARFERLFGLHVHESLGMTEMAGISTITPPGVHGPAGCVGFPLPYTRLRIVALDAAGGITQRELPPGEHGMVLFKSPNLFSGFVDPEDNARAFTDDGWLVSGDVGWLDPEGRLHLTGRAKDLIIRSGHNIDPKTIEDALGAHPAVEYCAAVGAPDAYAGELPVVFATLRSGATATVDELMSFVANRVDEAPAKPKSITLIAKMPMTNVGKIYKPELRMMAAQTVVTARVNEVWAESKEAAPCPRVRIDAQNGIEVLLDEAALGDRAAQVRERLRQMLAPLPIKTTVTFDVATERNAS